jgi:hypothetical protein
VVCCVRPGHFRGKFAGWFPATATALGPLFAADTLTVRGDIADGARLTGEADFPDTPSAERAVLALRGGTAVTRAILGSVAAELAGMSPGSVTPGAVDGFQEVADRLAAASVSRVGRTVAARFAVSPRGTVAAHPGPYSAVLYALTVHGGPQLMTAGGPATPTGYRPRPAAEGRR